MPFLVPSKEADSRTRRWSDAGLEVERASLLSVGRGAGRCSGGHHAAPASGGRVVSRTGPSGTLGWRSGAEVTRVGAGLSFSTCPMEAAEGV